MPARAHEPLPPLRLLNAFRHHGLDHLYTERGLALDAACSTPSGITASITVDASPRGVDAAALLNAFRHHGLDHTPIA